MIFQYSCHSSIQLSQKNFIKQIPSPESFSLHSNYYLSNIISKDCVSWTLHQTSETVSVRFFIYQLALCWVPFQREDISDLVVEISVFSIKKQMSPQSERAGERRD